VVFAQDSTQPLRYNDAGVTAPVVSKSVKPNYTKKALKQGIEGVVELEALVRVDGTVGDVRVTKSLDAKYGLDEEARKTIKRWRFIPGRKDDKPVPVLVIVEMSFTRK
jgi:protein TonB